MPSHVQPHLTRDSVFSNTVSPEGNVSVVPGYLQANEMDSVNFTCETQGGPGNTYQWLRNTEVLSGETNPVLSLENVTISDEGRYTCNVTNPGGSGISNTATLISTCIRMYVLYCVYVQMSCE